MKNYSALHLESSSRSSINLDNLPFGFGVCVTGFSNESKTKIIFFNNIKNSNRLFLVCHPQTKIMLVCRLIGPLTINLGEQIVLEEVNPALLPLVWAVENIQSIQAFNHGCFSVKDNYFDMPEIGKAVQELNTRKLKPSDEFFLDFRENDDHRPDVRRFIVMGTAGLFKSTLYVREIFFNTYQLIINDYYIPQGKYNPGDHMVMYMDQSRNAATISNFSSCKIVTSEDFRTT